MLAQWQLNSRHNRISDLPLLPYRNAPGFRLRLAHVAGQGAAFELGGNEIRGRFWSHKGRGVPLRT